jgi:hypothetical protein
MQGGGSPLQMLGSARLPLPPNSLDLVGEVDDDEPLGDEPPPKKMSSSSLTRSPSSPLLPMKESLVCADGDGCVDGLVWGLR